MEKRFRQAETATWVGIVGNILLAVIKGVTGFIAGSKALIADAAHSASDVVGSIAVLAGLRAAQKPPDKEHPYGHGKAENVATIVVALILIIIGFEIALSSTKVFFGERPQAPEVYSVFVLLLAIGCKEALFQYKYRLGKRINSPALIAEAWHHRSDVFSSIAALIGVAGAIVGSYLGYYYLIYLDPLAGIIVSVLVIKTGYNLAMESINVVLEQVLKEEETIKYRDTVQKVIGVMSIDQLHARIHGHYVIIDLKIGVNSNMSVEEGHEISKKVKQNLIKTHQDVKDVIIHVNPVDRRNKGEKIVDQSRTS